MTRIRASTLIVCALLSMATTVAQPADAQEPHELSHEMAQEDPAPDFAEEPPRRESMLLFSFNALGWRYTLAIPFFAFLAFVLALILVIRGRTWATGPATLMVVAMPMLVGVFAWIEGLMVGYLTFASSPVITRSNDLYAGYAASIVPPMVALLLSVPAYLVALVGLFLRAMTEQPTGKI